MRHRVRGRALAVIAALFSLFAIAGCGSSGKSSSASAQAASGGGKNCTAAIGIEAPITGAVSVLGLEQLHFAQLAVQQDNQANGTHITLAQGDTQLQPAQATTVTQQFIANPKILAVVGPAATQEVQAVGPLFARADMGFVSASATGASLTASDRNPTFFRVTSKDSVQGPEDAHYIVTRLHPKAIMVVDDQQAYSLGLVNAMIPIFKAAGIQVDHESVTSKTTDFSSLVAKITPQTSVVVLPIQVAANAQQFGKDIQEQHKHAIIFGTDSLFSPSSFKIPGSYVSSFGPDITAIPADASIAAAAKARFGSFGTFGPPVYAATHVVDMAIASACKSGTPTRSKVLAAIKSTNEPTSILGQPIRFNSHGDLVNGKFFLFKIGPNGAYHLLPNAL